MNPWIHVVLGGLFETGWAVTMKMSDGFSRIEWVLPTMALLVVSVLFLNKGLVAGLPAGSTYSVWVGIGAIGSLVAGLLLFGDLLSPLKALCVALILAGVLGIENESSKRRKAAAESLEGEE
jgi:quaternary ammonium compound-resistance protein SugE